MKIKVDLYSKSPRFDSNEYQTTYSFDKPIDIEYRPIDSTRWFRIATNNQILITRGIKNGVSSIYKLGGK